MPTTQHRPANIIVSTLGLLLLSASCFAATPTEPPTTSQPRGPAIPNSNEKVQSGALTTMESYTTPKPLSSVGIYSMADAISFVANPANKCASDDKRDVCFARLSVAAGGTQPTLGTTACPIEYEAVMSFGNSVKDGSGNELIYYPADSRRLQSSKQWHFYAINGYSQEVCQAWDRWNARANTRTAIPNYGIGRDIDLPNEYSDFNPDHRYCYVEAGSGSGRNCYTLPHVPAPNSSCRWVAGAYWEYNYNINCLCRQATRPAGYYPAPKAVNGDMYPINSVSTNSHPTTTLCGKKTTVWRATTIPE